MPKPLFVRFYAAAPAGGHCSGKNPGAQARPDKMQAPFLAVSRSAWPTVDRPITVDAHGSIVLA